MNILQISFHTSPFGSVGKFDSGGLNVYVQQISKQLSIENNVSIGAHPSFNDPENFGRKRMNLSSSDVRKLIIDQYEILQRIAIL